MEQCGVEQCGVEQCGVEQCGVEQWLIAGAKDAVVNGSG